VESSLAAAVRGSSNSSCCWTSTCAAIRRHVLVEWVERWRQAKVRSELDGFPALRRWYQTGDVMNELAIELGGELAKRRPAPSGNSSGWSASSSAVAS
jgi:hypothetical protein